MSSSPLTLEIRSPSYPTPLTIQTSSTTTIAALKQQLAETHPTHPPVSDQRLIFQGKLLGDGEIISAVVGRTSISNVDGCVQVVHLVVKPSAASAASQGSAKEDAEASSSRHGATADRQESAERAQPSVIPQQEQSSSSRQTFAQVTTLGNAFQYVLVNNEPYLLIYPTPTNPNFLHLPNYSTTFDHAYDHLLWQQLLQPHLQHHHQIPHVHQAQAAPRVVFTTEAVAQRNARRTAALWLGLRLAFFLYIFCQGASFTRALILHVLAVGFWLWRTGIVRFGLQVYRIEEDRNPAAPPVLAQQAPPQPQPTQAPAPHDHTVPQQGDAVANGDADQQRLQQQQQAAEPSLLRKVERALFTFVTSLVPRLGADGVEGAGMDGVGGQDDGMGGEGLRF